MQKDEKGYPYKNILDRFKDPSKRFENAVKTFNQEMLAAFIEAEYPEKNTRLTPLERQSNQSSMTDNGQTVLHFFVRKKNYLIVEKMLQQGNDPNICTFFKETPAHWAAEEGDLNMLLLLQKYGADFSKTISQRGTMMWEEPYNPDVYQIYKAKTGSNLENDLLELGKKELTVETESETQNNEIVVLEKTIEPLFSGIVIEIDTDLLQASSDPKHKCGAMKP